MRALHLPLDCHRGTHDRALRPNVSRSDTPYARDVWHITFRPTVLGSVAPSLAEVVESASDCETGYSGPMAQERLSSLLALSLPKKTAGVAESVTENTIGHCISAVIQHLRGCLSTVALAGPACGTESRSRERNSIQIATHRGIDVSEM
jgi:hypothetical protein